MNRTNSLKINHLFVEERAVALMNYLVRMKPTSFYSFSSPELVSSTGPANDGTDRLVMLQLPRLSLSLKQKSAFFTN